MRRILAAVVTGVCIVIGCSGTALPTSFPATTSNASPGASAAVSQGPTGSPAVPEEVRYAIPNPTISLSHSPWVVAIGKGFFSEQGVEVELQFTPGTPAVMQALSSGSADMGSVDTFAIGSAVAAGITNVKAVCTYAAKNVYTLVVLADSAITQASQLKGKRIAVPSLGTGSYINARAIVLQAGLNPDTDVEFVPIEAQPAQLEALNSGTVDAIGTFDTTAGTFEAQGASLRVLAADGLRYQWSVIAASDEFIQDSPEAIVGVCRGVLQGGAYANACPAAALAIHKEQGHAAPDSDEAGIAIINARAQGGFVEPEGGGGKWGWLPIDHMDDLQQLYVDLGVIPTFSPVAENYTNEFVDQMQFDADSVRSQARNDGGC